MKFISCKIIEFIIFQYKVNKLILSSQHKDLKTYPKVLKNLTNVDITVKIRIEEENLEKEDTAYYATNICRGFYTPEPPSQEASQMQQSSTTQVKDHSHQIIDPLLVECLLITPFTTGIRINLPH